MGELYKRGKTWHADYVDRFGQRVRRSTKMKDKQLAARVLSKWETGERSVQLGIVSGGRANEPIADHLKVFRTSKIVDGRGEQHIDRTEQLVEAVVSFNGWTKLGDIDARGLNAYCQTLKDDEGQASRTIGSAITAVRTFCRWCVAHGGLLSDPTATTRKPSIKTDRRITRRMLLPEEWAWLVKALAVSGFKNGQTADERRLMYRTAIETGLRSNELRQLTRASLKLSNSEPHVVAKASTTKNAKEAKQFISDGLAKDLDCFCLKKRPGDTVFGVASRTEMARTLRSDIAEARVLWLESQTAKQTADDSDFLKSPNSEGDVVDFHALRHTCGAWLVQAGVTLSEVREIMRHSTIVLTVDHYGHLAPDARSKSRSVLGGLLG